MSRLAAFLRDPVCVPVVLGALLIGGTAWTFGWNWAVVVTGLVLVALVLMTPPGPQHPVLA